MNMTVEQYIQKGGVKCPFCLRDEIEGAGVEIDAGQASQDITCNLCGASWTDVYVLTNIVNLNDPGAKYPAEDWKQEVASGDTVLGYAEWREHKIDEEE